MSTPTLYDVRGGAAHITLNRPDNRNALSDDLVASLLADLRRALGDDSVRVVVLSGSGPVFCAGADLKSGGVRAGTGENPFVTVMKTIWDSPKPVIGKINGHAFGGGVGLTAVCDLTVAVDTAKFTFSEVRVGVIPAIISVVVLRKLGIQNGMWLFLTAERFDAARAVQIGLIHRAVPGAELDAAVDEVAAMVRLGGPIAIREAKQLIRRIPGMSMDDGFRYANEKIAALFASDEAAEGMRAFAEKRKPGWAE